MHDILKIENLTKKFKKKNFFSSDAEEIIAVDSINFSVEQGKILAIAGQSGSGKSTIAKLILRAIKPNSGKIFYNQEEIKDLLVFEDPIPEGERSGLFPHLYDDLSINKVSRMWHIEKGAFILPKEILLQSER